MKKKIHLKSSSLFDEAELKATVLVEHSYFKESKQVEYFNRLRLYDKQKQEVIQLAYSTEKEFKGYAQRTRQKMFCIEHLAKEQDLVPVFITLTLPSRFHPFLSTLKDGRRIYDRVNPKFGYKTLDAAIKEGYGQLNRFHNLFYKRIKYFTKGQCFFLKTVEMHKSFIPHMHCVYFVPRESLKDIYSSFETFKEEYDLGQSELEPARIKKGVTYASAYLLKYITKNLKSSADVAQMRLLDGWKRKYKIRLFSCSQLPMNAFILDKLYKSSTMVPKKKINSEKESKIKAIGDEVRKEVLDANTSFYTFFIKNAYVLKSMYDSKKDLIDFSTYGNRSSRFNVFLDVQRTCNARRYRYKTLSMKITYKGVDIYVDKQFIKLERRR